MLVFENPVLLLSQPPMQIESSPGFRCAFFRSGSRPGHWSSTFRFHQTRLESEVWKSRSGQSRRGFDVTTGLLGKVAEGTVSAERLDQHVEIYFKSVLEMMDGSSESRAVVKE